MPTGAVSHDDDDDDDDDDDVAICQILIQENSG